MASIIIWVVIIWVSLKKIYYNIEITDFKKYLPEAAAGELRKKMGDKYLQLKDRAEQMIKEAQEKDNPKKINSLLQMMEKYEEIAAIRCITGKTSARFEKLFKEFAKRLEIAVAEPPICRHCGKSIEIVGDEFFDYLRWNLPLIDKI